MRNNKYSLGLCVTVLAVLAALSACSDRDRNNPLDPGNPDRDRSNLGFNALAGNNQVLLEWNPLNFTDLAGIRVQRVETGGTDTVTVSDTTLAFNTTRFIDNTSNNGTTYSYHLVFDVEDSDERPTTLPDTVTPGPVFSWVELIDYGEVVLFTPDFRDEVVSLEKGFFDVLDIQVGSTIWVLEAGGVIHRFQRNGDLISSGDLTSVSAFQFHPNGRSTWVALASDAGPMYHYQESGQLITSQSVNLRVTSIAIDVLSSDVWVGSTEPAIGKINAITGTTAQFAASEFVSPELVVSARDIRGVWVGDRGSNSVIGFTTAGVTWERQGFSEVNDIAVNNDGTRVWVADANSDQVVILEGRTGRIINTITGLGNPFYLAFNRETDEVLVSGSTGLITSISQADQVVWSIQNPDRTGKMALAY